MTILKYINWFLEKYDNLFLDRKISLDDFEKFLMT